MRGQLLEFRGHDVLLASDGSRGYGTAQHQRPDAIVLDLMMPLMDGFTTLETLIGDPKTAQIPVIVVSALDGDERERCMGLGAHAYLRKPYNPEELIRAIESAPLARAV